MSAPRSAAPVVRLADAPVNWGVFGPRSAPLLTSGAYLDAVASHGYDGTELGAPGFLGAADDPGATRAALEQRGLALAGAYLDLCLSRPERIGRELADLPARARFVAASAPTGSSPVAVLADATDEPDRRAVACRAGRHPETWLPDERLDTLVESIHRAARICQDAGLLPVVHPHAGSYIETDREIRAVCERLDPRLVGLCLDTGHAWLGDSDPIALLRDYRSLIRHVHLKDVAPGVLSASRDEGWDMDRTWASGIFTGLGDGCVPLASFLSELLADPFEGWVVVEQDRVLRDAETPEDASATSSANRDWLGDHGLPRRP